MRDDYTTNSHYLTYTFLFEKVERVYFLNVEVKGLKLRVKQTCLRRWVPTVKPSAENDTMENTITLKLWTPSYSTLTILYLGAHDVLPTLVLLCSV